MSAIQDAVAEYEELGCAQLNGLLPVDLLDAYEEALFACIRMQALKLGLELPRAFSKDALNQAVVQLNQADAGALSEAAVMVRNTPAGLKLVSADPIVEASAALLDCPPELLVMSGPSIFMNIPSHKTRLYTWHAEANWYPKRRNFVNLWLPVGEAKRAGNGTMSVLEKSHREKWMYFAEYYGFDRETQGNRDLNLQYEIPESELQGYRRREIEAELGDFVAFAPHCVHRSNLNQSDRPSFALTIRVFDYRRDLTVSSAWAERPYRDAEASRSGGRFNLVAADL
ncbi:MAG TPA: phytanoyl-CoA dioxygenase family protein [Allosphingosinicella sp.]|nr:phytanoyl-CoA dioxygenase family protein [Allosphingosinicella sp.]